MKEIVTLLKAADAAARWHVNQRRKGATQEPYVTHLLEVAMLVAEATDGKDCPLVVAALLHDAIEDQKISRDEIADKFGEDVADLVVEVTDDKNLPKLKRKRLNIVHAPNLTPRAKILKLADKISNVRSVAASPPVGWDTQRRSDYIIWVKQVVAALNVNSPILKRHFNRASEDAERSVRNPIFKTLKRRP